MKKEYHVPDIPQNIPVRQRVKKLFDDSFSVSRILFLCSHFGSGKSMSMTLYFNGMEDKVCWMDADKTEHLVSVLKEMLYDNKNKSVHYFVIDNLHKLCKGEIEELKNIILESEHKFALISHVSMNLLFDNDLRYYVKMICFEDLHYTNEEIGNFFQSYNIELSEKDIALLEEETLGWQIYLFFVIESMNVSGLPCGKEVLTQAKGLLYQCLDEKFTKDFTEGERIFLLKIGCFENFSLQMIKEITGQIHVEKMIKKIMKKDSFIRYTALDCFSIEKCYIDYFVKRRKEYIDKEEIERIYRQAGDFYKRGNRIEEAIKCYLEIGDYQNMVDILEEAANFGIYHGEMYSIYKYYYMIPDKWISISPTMCTQFAFLSMLRCDFETARKWQEHVSVKCREFDKDEEIRNRWEKASKYLKICMFLGDIRNIEYKLEDYATMSNNGRLDMHNMNLTLNRPSLINGFWDLSVWAHLPEEKLVQYEVYLRDIFKDSFIGAANIIRAEFEYEKDNMEEALLHVVSALYELQNRELINQTFAAYYVQMKIMFRSGQTKTVKVILENMKKLVEEKKAKWLNVNLRVIEMKQMLYMGMNTEEIRHWMEFEAPDENTEINMKDMESYIMKIEGYILFEEYLHAITLLEKLRPLCRKWNRYTDLMLIEGLRTGIYARMGERKKARKYLLKALKLAEKPGYIHTLCDLGPLIYKVMLDLKDEHPGVGDGFFNECMRVIKEINSFYPNFLKRNAYVGISEAELSVLRLMALAKTNGEIAEELCISVNTVKFHCKNIYQKLGVKNRSAAVAAGRRKMLL